MEYDLTQALLDITWEQPMTREVTLDDRAKERPYSHVDQRGRLPAVVSTLRQLPKKEVEQELAPAREFLSRKEPPMRDALERLTRLEVQKPTLNFARPDNEFYMERTERVNPQQAYLESRTLPPNGYRPEYNKTIEFGRTPNPTYQPSVPFSAERIEEREVTVMPQRAFGVDKGYSGAPVNAYGPDNSRYLFENLLKVPERSGFLENQLTHQYKTEQLLNVPDAYRTTNGMRLKDESHLQLLETRSAAKYRDDLGDYLVPNMIARDKENVILENRMPGSNRLGESSLDTRALPFGVEKSQRKEVDRTQLRREPILFTDKQKVRVKVEQPEHLLAEYVEMMTKYDQPRVGREMERGEILDDLQTVLLRSNPFHVRYM